MTQTPAFIPKVQQIWLVNSGPSRLSPKGAGHLCRLSSLQSDVSALTPTIPSPQVPPLSTPLSTPSLCSGGLGRLYQGVLHPPSVS